MTETRTDAPTSEPNVEAAEERVEEAKASLEAKVDELGRRFRATKAKMDVRERVIAHPWPAVGIAAGAGLLLGVLGKSSARRSASVSSQPIDGIMTEGKQKSAFRTLLGVIAMPLLRRGAMELWQRYSQKSQRSDIDRGSGMGMGSSRMGDIPSMQSDPIPSRTR
ncbi:MAG: hypothetical protein H0T79_09510 [Deltaproteobacteria bacterium]|nr:hypothetical protein [Deltaproteobacteria bacterium]